jgi:peptide/nickel transport system ATP-binding protein
MIITIKDLFFKYDGAKNNTLDNVSLEIMRGDIYGIAGESGSGKTTLAKVITGLLNPDSGEVQFNFRYNYGHRISPVQILFQNNGDIVNPFRSGLETLTEVTKKRYPQNSSAEAERIKTALELSDDVLARKGFELSGGEQQRVALARVLAAGPELLILDEPFSAQDPQSQLNLISLFRRINTEYDITLICISHYTGLLRQLCRNIAIMYRGSIIEQQNCIDLFSKPEHPYTKYLLSAEDYNLSPDDLLKWRTSES